jgi:hypothetical protein
MTDQHPLTDDIIGKTFNPKFFTFSGENTTSWYNEEDMRAAADWQLKQVIEWIRDTHEEYIIKDLREAMRPTTTQEDWEDIQTAIERKDSVPIPTTLEELAQEMRPEVVDLPQANSDVCGEEGMERALQRTFEENDELMRKLSDS